MVKTITTIEKLHNLAVGESMTYMVGTGSWSGNPMNRAIVSWCSVAQETENYVFYQKLLSRNEEKIGTFEYMVKRVK